MDAITIRETGYAEMAYLAADGVPWHGHGQPLQADASIEEWEVGAGMNWRVLRGLVRYATEHNNGGMMVMPDQHVLFRSDNKKPLGIVSPKYKVVQPKQVLEFFRDLVATAGYRLCTAGTLFDGRRFWALASIGESAVVMGQDRVDGFLLLATSCDGTMPTTATPTSVRVVCQNTMRLALSMSKRTQVVVRHISRFDPEAVKDELGLARGAFHEFMGAARALAKVRMPVPRASTFVEKLLVDTKMVTAEDVSNSASFKKIMDLFQGSAMGGTLVSAEGSAWGLVNAVTEYVDHHSKAVSTENRMASAWFGRGDSLKTTSFEQALALV